MKSLVSVLVLFCLSETSAAQAIRTSFTPYSDAKPVLEALAEILPPELRNLPAGDQEKSWNRWVQKRDLEIRARLSQGDADSVVNFLMFGVSFTAEPRLTGPQIQSLSSEIGKPQQEAFTSETGRLCQRRINDLIRGAKLPGQNERLSFVRKTLENADIKLDLSDGTDRARVYLNENIVRVLREQSNFQEALAAAKALNDPTEEFAEVSQVYKDRGLSLDASLPPNYALEAALRDMVERRMLAPGSVKRIGIIGPGLDFTDKHEGLDFYPVQTLQPFAVADSVIRLGLGTEGGLELFVLDLSPRVLKHVERIVAGAGKGKGYVIQLPREDSRGWTPELVSYWKSFGNQIGSPATAAKLPTTLRAVSLRTVNVRPHLLKRVQAVDTNVVLQRASLQDDEKLDLLIATNILVYYDTFEQSLALTNIAAMLKPGGFLLTNNLLLELPGSKMISMGHTSVSYSGKESDGDTIIRYRRTP